MTARAIGVRFALLLVWVTGCGAETFDRNGIYKGEDEAYVEVREDTVVVKLQLRYGGNVGFTFASGRVSAEGRFPIANDAFSIRTAQATIGGTFASGNTKIAGTWQDGEVSGTWSARHQ